MKKLKNLFCIPLALMISIATSTSVYGETPYRAYNYDYWGDAVEMPNPYMPSATYEKGDFGELGLNAPNDLFYDNRDNIYIADTGNNRIIKLDTDYTLESELSTFNNGDTFNKPTGIFVDDEDKLYVCDSGNNRILVLDSEGELLQEIKDIQSTVLPANFVFIPQQIVVDKAGRMYVLAQNIFEGLMTFEPDGRFSGYFGTIKVSYNPMDLFWRNLATEEQRSKMLMFIPTEFINTDINEDGFIYTTEVASYGNPKVKKLNPSGKNVLINYTDNPIVGDLVVRGQESYFADIDITEIGIYTALDRTNGRVFAYDSEGNNLYTFGVVGNEDGNFKTPVAIENINGDIAVLDQQLNRLIVFEPTFYGSLINEAINLRYNGDESEAVEVWKKVLEINTSYEIANRGIGKAYLSSGDNVLAMKYLKLGYDRKNYSVAFKRYRNEILQENIEGIIAVVIGLIALRSLLKFYKKRKLKLKLSKEGDI